VIIANNGTHILDFVFVVIRDGVYQSKVYARAQKLKLLHHHIQSIKKTNIAKNTIGLVSTKKFTLIGFKDVKKFVNVVLRVFISIVITFVQNSQNIVKRPNQMELVFVASKDIKFVKENVWRSSENWENEQINNNKVIFNRVYLNLNYTFYVSIFSILIKFIYFN